MDRSRIKLYLFSWRARGAHYREGHPARLISSPHRSSHRRSDGTVPGLRGLRTRAGVPDWVFERLGTHLDLYALPIDQLTPAAFKRPQG